MFYTFVKMSPLDALHLLKHLYSLTYFYNDIKMKTWKKKINVSILGGIWRIGYSIIVVCMISPRCLILFLSPCTWHYDCLLCLYCDFMLVCFNSCRLTLCLSLNNLWLSNNRYSLVKDTYSFHISDHSSPSYICRHLVVYMNHACISVCI